MTALAWDRMTLVPGSAQGMVLAWDRLTFDYLQLFLSPLPCCSCSVNGDAREREAVSQILVGPEKEVLLVAVGSIGLVSQSGSFF
jgi:hypothetical protein